jgi:hypothetical protein
MVLCIVAWYVLMAIFAQQQARARS